jgi:hypothetical protein
MTPEQWELVTDVVQGRREIIGWARKGKKVAYESEGVSRKIEEWLALCFNRHTAAKTIRIACDRCGWLPEKIDDVLLEGAPHYDVDFGKILDWEHRETREIGEAAERYRAQMHDQQIHRLITNREDS